MRPLRITIVLPFPVTKPVGGAKIMYEYANRFREAGHTVTVVHSIKRPHKKMKSPLWWKRFVFFLQKAERPHWFPLHKNIRSLIVNEVTDKYMPDADIIFSTWWQMAYAISELSPSKGKPVNLIQDYENWAGQEDLLLASYRLPIHHAVIASYLKEILLANGATEVAYFPNAIDTSQFFIQKPVEEREPQSIIMLYSKEARKGSEYGIETFKKLKEKYPALKVTFFSVYQRPDELPEWISFYQKPGNLPVLFNEHVIFFSPSLGEGWALPPAEAMASGCAVVCTNIGGHADYAKDGETALLVEKENADDMAAKLSALLDNNEQRIALAKQAHQFLTSNFNWEHSVKTAERFFYSLLN